MKRLVSLVIVFVCIASSGARADRADTSVEARDSDGPGRNLLLVNPGDLFTGVLSLEYERALGPFFGITAGLSIWAFRSLFSSASEPAYTALSPEFGVRIHFIQAAPGGLWVGPYVSAGYLFARSEGTLSRAWSWGIGAAIGYNFIFGRHFTFQIGAGGGFTDYGDRLVWFPRLRLGLGVAF